MRITKVTVEFNWYYPDIDIPEEGREYYVITEYSEHLIMVWESDGFGGFRWKNRSGSYWSNTDIIKWTNLLPE